MAKKRNSKIKELAGVLATATDITTVSDIDLKHRITTATVSETAALGPLTSFEGKIPEDDVLTEAITDQEKSNEVGRLLDPTEGQIAERLIFQPHEKPEEAKAKAIERSRKVELKENVRTLVDGFREEIEIQLKELSDRVEAQLNPIVEAVSSVAVARRDFIGQLAQFREKLNNALDLNDELEPLDIGYGEFFDNSVSGQALDATLKTIFEEAFDCAELP
jgi:hypothetical protein